MFSRVSGIISSIGQSVHGRHSSIEKQSVINKCKSKSKGKKRGNSENHDHQQQPSQNIRDKEHKPKRSNSLMKSLRGSFKRKKIPLADCQNTLKLSPVINKDENNTKKRKIRKEQSVAKNSQNQETPRKRIRSTSSTSLLDINERKRTRASQKSLMPHEDEKNVPDQFSNSTSVESKKNCGKVTKEKSQGINHKKADLTGPVNSDLEQSGISVNSQKSLGKHSFLSPKQMKYLFAEEQPRFDVISPCQKASTDVHSARSISKTRSNDMKDNKSCESAGTEIISYNPDITKGSNRFSYTTKPNTNKLQMEIQSKILKNQLPQNYITEMLDVETINNQTIPSDKVDELNVSKEIYKRNRLSNEKSNLASQQETKCGQLKNHCSNKTNYHYFSDSSIGNRICIAQASNEQNNNINEYALLFDLEMKEPENSVSINGGHLPKSEAAETDPYNQKVYRTSDLFESEKVNDSMIAQRPSPVSDQSIDSYNDISNDSISFEKFSFLSSKEKMNMFEKHQPVDKMSNRCYSIPAFDFMKEQTRNNESSINRALLKKCHSLSDLDKFNRYISFIESRAFPNNTCCDAYIEEVLDILKVKDGESNRNVTDVNNPVDGSAEKYRSIPLVEDILATNGIVSKTTSELYPKAFQNIKLKGKVTFF